MTTEDKAPGSWSRDGRFLLYSTVDASTGADIWVLPLQGDGKPFPFLKTEFQEVRGQFSPDGRWIAYLSTESGNPEIYVRPFAPEKGSEAGSGGKWMISKGGGAYVFWRGDGKELFYLSQTLQMMAADASTEKTFQAGPSRQLFNVQLLSAGDVSADGKRFLRSEPEGSNAPSPFMVVTNWPAALRK